MNSVFVYCELEGTQIEEVSFELLTKGRKLASELGVKLEAIVAGHDVKGKVESQILPYGVDVLHVFDAPGLSPSPLVRTQQCLCTCLNANSRRFA